MLLTWHNLHYYQDIMRGLRGAIESRLARPLDRRIREPSKPWETFRHIEGVIECPTRR